MDSRDAGYPDHREPTFDDAVPEYVEPDWDAMTDEQFEAHLAEQRAMGERKEAWRLWLEAHPYGFAKGGRR